MKEGSTFNDSTAINDRRSRRVGYAPGSTNPRTETACVVSVRLAVSFLRITGPLLPSGSASRSPEGGLSLAVSHRNQPPHLTTGNWYSNDPSRRFCAPRPKFIEKTPLVRLGRGPQLRNQHRGTGTEPVRSPSPTIRVWGFHRSHVHWGECRARNPDSSPEPLDTEFRRVRSDEFIRGRFPDAVVCGELGQSAPLRQLS